MTVKEFCINITEPHELVGICENGNLLTAFWIDDNDNFAIPEKYQDKEVNYECWRRIHTIDENINTTWVPVHFINI